MIVCCNQRTVLKFFSQGVASRYKKVICPHYGNRKCKSTFVYFLFGSSKENYVYNLYHQRKEISKELHQFCLDQGHADHNLIVKGEKPGNEHLAG
ncbi:unnamed protein product [Musa acuminata subsp. malaccensis]|uniref:(wild Malaysian banana) hypothetical protein n=1 Tax=Musa acuminata subsp. malaccensis TaxID=214687 RepID=A0A804IFK2_MUSAM|nr:unnamed protein product [Musa acuminata subsp. malaccensis]